MALHTATAPSTSVCSATSTCRGHGGDALHGYPVASSAATHPHGRPPRHVHGGDILDGRSVACPRRQPLLLPHPRGLVRNDMSPAAVPALSRPRGGRSPRLSRGLVRDDGPRNLTPPCTPAASCAATPPAAVP